MKKLFILLLLSILPLSCAFAHPHIFIDLTVKVEIDDYGIAGFREFWTIAGEFGENICLEYDWNKNGSFDDEETQAVKNELFENVKKYNYYTYIDTDGQTWVAEEVEDFTVEEDEGEAVFSFFVPCLISSENLNQTYELSIIDWSKYVSFGLRYIDDPSNKKVSYSLNIERNDEYYSHSSIFGNASFLIVMKRPEQPVKLSSSAAAGRQLVKLTTENTAPSETITNPFTSGVRIKDENPNPFMSY